MADHFDTLLDILERHGVGGQDLKDLADEAIGERDPETGMREAPKPKGKAAAADKTDS